MTSSFLKDHLVEDQLYSVTCVTSLMWLPWVYPFGNNPNPRCGRGCPTHLGPEAWSLPSAGTCIPLPEGILWLEAFTPRVGRKCQQPKPVTAMVQIPFSLPSQVSCLLDEQILPWGSESSYLDYDSVVTCLKMTLLLAIFFPVSLLHSPPSVFWDHLQNKLQLTLNSTDLNCVGSLIRRSFSGRYSTVL